MSEVTLTIAGREYTVACAEGEEPHVAMLGSQIDAKLQELGGNLASQESQNLVFGGLLIADELHEARMAASARQAELEAKITSLKESSHEAKLAIGQRDELTLTVTRLEQELDGLQSAHQRHSAEVDDLRSELEQRREQAQTATDEQEKLAAQVAELARERDGLAAQIENKDLLLQKANDHIDELKAAAAKTPAAGAFPVSAGTSTDDPDLAPALERFADLLETCADKLESKAASA